MRNKDGRPNRNHLEVVGFEHIDDWPVGSVVNIAGGGADGSYVVRGRRGGMLVLRRNAP